MLCAAPLECKKYDVDTFRGCDDTSDGVLNYCEKVTEVDNTLCRSEPQPQHPRVNRLNSGGR